MKRKQRIWCAVAVVALAGCGKQGAAECEAWFDKTLACDESLKNMSAEERSAAGAMLKGLCVEAMSGRDPGGSGEVNAMAKEMNETVRQKARCAGSTKTCEEFAACEKAVETRK